MSKDIEAILAGNNAYEANKSQWNYLYNSYVGGPEYKAGKYLTKYTNETEAEYNARIAATNLDNHCSSVIAVYNSFLFRKPPTRILGTLETPTSIDFLWDADYEGRSLDNFMKEVATWASVFGHCWVIVAKPDIGAVTEAEQLAAGIRPYVSLQTPLTVLSWKFSRLPNGAHELSYLKYVESNDDVEAVVKEWTKEEITTYYIDIENDEYTAETVINGIGIIPAVIAYNKRSHQRGIGISDISDIADAQRYIYNCTSEMEQSIRLNTHPSLVVTKDTTVGVGAGSIILTPEDMDPGLKPYVIAYDGADVASILAAIEKTVEAIDKMANTGAVRAVESRTLSGVAMQTEFQLLNARLSEKADNLELAEEQIWRFIAIYDNKEWTGSIEYPGSFNIQDVSNELAQLKDAKDAITDESLYPVIDSRVLAVIGEDQSDANNQV